METLPEECQYLAASHVEEQDGSPREALVETLWLLAARGGREARKVMREKGTYIVVRELHLRMHEGDKVVEGVGAEKVVSLCERIVDLLMGDESGETKENGGEGGKGGGTGKVEELDEEEEDNAIVPIF